MRSRMATRSCSSPQSQAEPFKVLAEPFRAPALRHTTTTTYEKAHPPQVGLALPIDRFGTRALGTKSIELEPMVQQHVDQYNYQDQPQAAAGVISPTPAVRPTG
jgi:hypothetical protein